MGNIAFSGGYELANWNKIETGGDKCVTKLALLAKVSICVASKYYLFNDREQEDASEARSCLLAVCRVNNSDLSVAVGRVRLPVYRFFLRSQTYVS